MPVIDIPITNPNALRKAQDNIKRELAKYQFSEEEKSLLLSKLRHDYFDPMLEELQTAPLERYETRMANPAMKRIVELLKKRKYKRAKKALQSWDYQISTTRDGFQVRVSNDSPDLKSTVGLIGIGRTKTSIQRYTKDIERFYTTNNWQPAYQIIHKQTDKANEGIRKIIIEWFNAKIR